MVATSTKVCTDEWGNVETFKTNDEKAIYYRDVGVAMAKTGMRLYGDGNWTGKWILSAEDDKHGDKSYYMKTEDIGRVVAVETTINADISTIFREAWNNVEKSPDFVPSMQEYKVLTDISDHTRLVYTVAREAFGGLVSSRDFVNVNTWRIIDDVYTHASKSVEYSDMLPQKGKIRAEQLVGWMRLAEIPGEKGRTKACVMGSADYKGMLPKSLTDRASIHYLADYVRNFKKYLESLSD